MRILRTSPRGLQFYMISLCGVDRNKTQIILVSNPKKSIIVDHSFEKLSQAWFQWQIKGDKIQFAFPFLSDDEREFILTGITKEEWDKIFPDEEKSYYTS